MKKILLTMLMVLAVSFSAQAMQINIAGQDFEYLPLAYGETVGMPSYTAGTDFGYYLWTDDAERHQWHVRWSGDGNARSDGNGAALYSFNGNVYLSANTLTDVKSFAYETSGSYIDMLFSDSDSAAYFAFANVGQDGFDFTILGDVRPSYLGFDLNVLPLNTAAMTRDLSNIANDIYIGSSKINPASGDFAVAAPIPEPTTLLLLGSGLLGLAFLKKRKLK